MKIMNPVIYVPEQEISNNKVLRLERYGRVCYKSENIITLNSSSDFIRGIIKSGHESVIEHEKATVLIVCDRGITHEIVRHRIGSYSQESTRYCNYSKEKFGNEITVIQPYFYNDDNRETLQEIWEETCKHSESSYLKLLSAGQPQEARSILPNSLKTEIVVTFNFREWRHFFRLRCSPSAHPQMRQIAIPLLKAFNDKMPCLFEDIPYDKNFPSMHYAKINFTDETFNLIRM